MEKTANFMAKVPKVNFAGVLYQKISLTKSIVYKNIFIATCMYTKLYHGFIPLDWLLQPVLVLNFCFCVYQPKALAIYHCLNMASSSTYQGCVNLKLAIICHLFEANTYQWAVNFIVHSYSFRITSRSMQATSNKNPIISTRSSN